MQIVATAFVVMLFLLFEAAVSNNISQTKAMGITPTQNNCSTTSDADLVKTAKEALAAIPEIKDQMRHLNVSITKRVVKLEGWLDGQALINKAIVTARKTKCVRRVISKLKPHGGGNCGPGQTPCGDTCIERGSSCTIEN